MNAVKIILFFFCLIIIIAVCMVSIGNTGQVLTFNGIRDSNDWLSPNHNVENYAGEMEQRLNMYIHIRDRKEKREKNEKQIEPYKVYKNKTDETLHLEDVKIHIVSAKELQELFPQFDHPIGVARRDGQIWVTNNFSLDTLGHEIKHLLNYKYPHVISNPDN